MFWKTIIFLVICYNVEAQDTDCDYYQKVEIPKTYYIQTPEYPYNYYPGRACRWIGECINNNSVCRVDCQIEMPESPNCIEDRLLISRSGDEWLIGADRYCGIRNLTITSFEGKISIGLMVSKNSRGGRFSCRLKSKILPNKPEKPYCRCGEMRQTRIVGGNATGEHQYPMMAGLRDENTSEIFCGATVINWRWVISAAHCFHADGQYRLPRDLRTIVGHRDIHRTMSFQVKQYFTHPKFVHNSDYDWDVALVQSLTDMLLNDNVVPVCLPYALASDSLQGQNVTVLGWGSLAPGRPTSEILQQVELGVVSLNYCQQSYPDIEITSRRICTFARGKDSCQMDSGGPLLVSKGGYWFLAGVVSFGLDCAAPVPSVNTRITPYLNWITKTIGHHSICVKTLSRP